MATVHDVAKYILERLGPMSAMKLQKLCYYSLAWHMVWDEEELFQEDFEAWANGPVCRELYREHRGQFTVSADDISGSSAALEVNERDSIDVVVQDYGRLNGRALSNLTHAEHPWRNTRGELSPTALSDRVIHKDKIWRYYDGLYSDESLPTIADAAYDFD